MESNVSFVKRKRKFSDTKKRKDDVQEDDADLTSSSHLIPGNLTELHHGDNLVTGLLVDNSNQLQADSVQNPSYSVSRLTGSRAANASIEEEKDDPAYQNKEDRTWYDNEEFTLFSNVDPNSFALTEIDLQEARLAKKQIKQLGAKANMLSEDALRWEEQQMRISEILPGRSRNTPLSREQVDEDHGPKIQIVTEERIPPFLQGDVQHTKQLTTVLPIKDPTSDMAKLSRKGSDAVRSAREKREQNQNRVKYWELSETQIGGKQKEQEERTAQLAATEAEKKKGMISSASSSNAMQPRGPDDGGYLSAMAKTRTSSLLSREERWKRILEERRNLPVFMVRSKLLALIRENPVIIIVGETGSGKTTQLTQYIYEEFFSGSASTDRGIIGCTQPRRVAAVSVSQRVAEEMNVALGDLVGYSIRFEDCTSKQTKIKYMTDGILLRETLLDADLDKYDFVIMDEAHERSLNTDVLFGVMRNVLTRRRDLRLIVTSATLDSEKFSNFFGNCPVFTIPGRTFPVDVFYARSMNQDYVEAAVRQTLQIHLQAPLPGDILLFMTGQEDIQATCDLLAERMTLLENPPSLLILPIYSQLSADLQSRIFEPAPEGCRKVIVSTNIAETSLTVNGVTFVIDTGFCKMKVYNSQVGMDMLLVCPVSQAAANQRAGRAGRTAAGKCYRLYTEVAFQEELLAGSVPEIQRTNLDHVVLLLKSIGIKNLLDFSFMDSPPSSNVAKSMLDLWVLGALDDSGELTSRGRKMVNFPLDPNLSSMLLSSIELGCCAEVLTIVAMLSAPTIFVRPRGREDEAESVREKFLVPESDHLTFLHVFQRWKAFGSNKDWCARHFLNFKSLSLADEVRKQLEGTVASAASNMGEGVNRTKWSQAISSCGTDWDVVREAVCSSYFQHAAKLKSLTEYVNLRTGVQSKVHPTSALALSNVNSEFIVYHELVYTGKQEYMNLVTSVDPIWLVKYGSMFYRIRNRQADTQGGGQSLPESKLDQFVQNFLQGMGKKSEP